MVRLLPIVFLALACTPVVGDKCTSDRQCGSTLVCDLTTPEGYCTQSPCRKGECPPEATCVDFGQEAAYCMRTCGEGEECRDGLQCRPAATCVPGEGTPTSSQPCSFEGHSFCGYVP